MIKLVSETPVEQVRQVRLEDDIQTAFAKAAAAMLEFICSGNGERDGQTMVELMADFVGKHRHAEPQSIDPQGIAIRMPRTKEAPAGEDDPDALVNTILRGALRMVAARLVHRGATDNVAYQAALDELARGVTAAAEELRRRP
jgi:hypothetical protein